MEEASRFKVVTFISAADLDPFVEALRSARVNRIGNYENCLSWMPVTSTWTTLQGATPHIGTVGEVSVEAEYRIEMLVDAADLRRVVAAIREAHPYEVPEIDIYPVHAPDDL